MIELKITIKDSCRKISEKEIIYSDNISLSKSNIDLLDKIKVLMVKFGTSNDVESPDITVTAKLVF